MGELVRGGSRPGKVVGTLALSYDSEDEQNQHSRLNGLTTKVSWRPAEATWRRRPSSFPTVFQCHDGSLALPCCVLYKSFRTHLLPKVEVDFYSVVVQTLLVGVVRTHSHPEARMVLPWVGPAGRPSRVQAPSLRALAKAQAVLCRRSEEAAGEVAQSLHGCMSK